MRHLGYDIKIIRLLESMYQNTASSVRVGSQGELSSWFETLVGVLQGCVLSPLLFNVMLEIVMALSLEDKDIGATISGFLCSNLRFADDIALLSESDKGLQSQVDSLHVVSTRFGLKISTSKTEVQCCSRDPPAIQINIDGTKLGQVEQFTYLGGVLSCDNSSENDIKRRIGLATGASASLNTIWASKEITQETKLRVYRSLVLSILLYNSETWTLKESDKSRLLVFEMTILRRILGVTRRDRWRNEDIRMTLGFAQNCCGRSTTSPSVILWTCLQDESRTAPIHFFVWEDPGLETCWQTKEKMVWWSEDRLCWAGSVDIWSCVRNPGPSPLERDVRWAAEAHFGVAKAISPSKSIQPERLEIYDYLKFCYLYCFISKFQTPKYYHPVCVFIVTVINQHWKWNWWSNAYTNLRICAKYRSPSWWNWFASKLVKPHQINPFQKSILPNWTTMLQVHKSPDFNVSGVTTDHPIVFLPISSRLFGTCALNALNVFLLSLSQQIV